MVGGEENDVREAKKKSERRKRVNAGVEKERERESAGGLIFNVINEL